MTDALASQAHIATGPSHFFPTSIDPQTPTFPHSSYQPPPPKTFPTEPTAPSTPYTNPPHHLSSLTIVQADTVPLPPLLHTPTLPQSPHRDLSPVAQRRTSCLTSHYRPTGSSHLGAQKPQTRAWTSKITKRKMVLGDDIGLKDSVSLSLCALVGQISYKDLCRSELTPWVHSTWWPLLGYDPKITHLTCGWLCFHFKSPEDSSYILEHLWTLDGGSLLLKLWWINFDPSLDYFIHRHLWVLLPGLPLHLWNQKSLESIGNALGRLHLCGASISSKLRQETGKSLGGDRYPRQTLREYRH
jgi:hypothetical protein